MSEYVSIMHGIPFALSAILGASNRGWMYVKEHAMGKSYQDMRGMELAYRQYDKEPAGEIPSIMRKNMIWGSVGTWGVSLATIIAASPEHDHQLPFAIDAALALVVPAVGYYTGRGLTSHYLPSPIDEQLQQAVKDVPQPKPFHTG